MKHLGNNNNKKKKNLTIPKQWKNSSNNFAHS